MLDDYVIAASAAVIVFAAVILATLLVRYSRMIQEADKSTKLAKDVWDSMNSRFSVVDARIIDLMARTEVLSTRLAPPSQAPQPQTGPPLPPASAAPSSSPPVPAVSLQPAPATLAPPVTSVPHPVPPLSAVKIPEVARPAEEPPAVSAAGSETELRILRFLAAGPRSSREITVELHKSREHTGRLMKNLFDRGLVVRNDRHKPYVYEVTERGKTYLTG